jgi:protein-S-isoprenylcysteine O-methyltransferase Ste14
MPSQQLAMIYTLWGLWVASWFLAAVWSARTEARPGGSRGLFYYVFTFAGAAMLFGPPRYEDGLWTVPDQVQWALVGATAFGFLFCWWARLHLGSLWSGAVTKKVGHHVVDTGPYRLVRHPIYTGIILSSFATAFAKATPLAIAGAATMAFGWFLKARLEERFLREQLGKDAYDAYAARVPMLVPFA